MNSSVRPFEWVSSLFPRGHRRPWPWPLRVVFGLVLLLVGVLAWHEFEPLLLFRPVDGLVVYSEVGAVRLRVGRGRTRTRYSPTVIYRYVVNGETMTSAQYARTPMVGARRGAQREARHYLRGTRVQAWYNPYLPAEAVLTRAPNPVLLAILAAVAFMAWLFAMALLAPRHALAAGQVPAAAR